MQREGILRTKRLDVRAGPGMWWEGIFRAQHCGVDVSRGWGLQC